MGSCFFRNVVQAPADPSGDTDGDSDGPPPLVDSSDLEDEGGPTFAAVAKAKPLAKAKPRPDRLDLWRVPQLMIAADLIQLDLMHVVDLGVALRAAEDSVDSNESTVASSQDLA